MESKECFVRIVYPAEWFPVTIAFTEGRLSIMGSYNGSSGQISGELQRLVDERAGNLYFHPHTAQKLCDIWKRWHLNDMRAGTPKQEEALRKYSKVYMPKYDYVQACEYLKSIGLYMDGGYRYGTAWLKEEVPQDVLRWLFSLPGDGSTADDVCPTEILEQDFLLAIAGRC